MENIKEIIMKMINDNKKNVIINEYDKGYLHGCHDALVGVLNRLNIEHKEEYYND